MLEWFDASAAQFDICTQSFDTRPIAVMNYGKSYFLCPPFDDNRTDLPFHPLFCSCSNYHFRRIGIVCVPLKNCVTEFRFCLKLSSFYCYANANAKLRKRFMSLWPTHRVQKKVTVFCLVFDLHIVKRTIPAAQKMFPLSSSTFFSTMTMEKKRTRVPYRMNGTTKRSTQKKNIQTETDDDQNKTKK